MTIRRVVALVCVLALVTAAFVPAASPDFSTALVPLASIFGIVVVISVLLADDSDSPLTNAPFVSVRSPRAPPFA